eukprot:TRINITY_DN333_c0_g1_i1.p1 TRINITY_DN333_c0_g1~~TRINITY_DN333_c0_g1_i1.p1  ORF type:complete len:225 (+),score=28.60 TRINITY_DN333_c0_g1_i1:76-750(+)
MAFSKALLVFSLLFAVGTCVRVEELAEELEEARVSTNHSDHDHVHDHHAIPMKERIALINERKCTYPVKCGGETFMVDSLQCSPGAKMNGGKPCKNCDCGGYEDCLTFGAVDSGEYDPEKLCKERKGQFHEWDVPRRGPMVCGRAVDGVRSHQQIKAKCESDPTCWGYSILTDVLYAERPDVRYAICGCDHGAALHCSGRHDEVKTYLRVSDVVSDDEWVLDDD